VFTSLFLFSIPLRLFLFIYVSRSMPHKPHTPYFAPRLIYCRYIFFPLIYSLDDLPPSLSYTSLFLFHFPSTCYLLSPIFSHFCFLDGSSTICVGWSFFRSSFFASALHPFLSELKSLNFMLRTMDLFVGLLPTSARSFWFLLARRPCSSWVRM